jgi:hypothetical protein
MLEAECDEGDSEGGSILPSPVSLLLLLITSLIGSSDRSRLRLPGTMALRGFAGTAMLAVAASC